MKLSEVIAKLEENSELKFECIWGCQRRVFRVEGKYFYLDIYGRSGKLILPYNGGKGYNGNLAVDMYWQPVVESVDFMTAVNSREKIRPAECFHNSIEAWYFAPLSEWFYMMTHGNMHNKELDYINGLWEVEP